MHDRNGKELKVGDLVLVPMVITQLSPSEDYCNVSAVSAFGRRPDDQPETFGAINTAVMLRANPEDEVSFVDAQEAAAKRAAASVGEGSTG